MRQVLVAKSTQTILKRNRKNCDYIELNKNTSLEENYSKKTKVLIKLTATENTGSFTTARKTVEKTSKSFLLRLIEIEKFYFFLMVY